MESIESRAKSNKDDYRIQFIQQWIYLIMNLLSHFQSYFLPKLFILLINLHLIFTQSFLQQMSRGLPPSNPLFSWTPFSLTLWIFVNDQLMLSDVIASELNAKHDEYSSNSLSDLYTRKSFRDLQN